MHLMKTSHKKHGGARPGSGPKNKHNEPTISKSFRWPVSLVEKIDAERGDVPFSNWVIEKLRGADSELQ